MGAGRHGSSLRRWDIEWGVGYIYNSGSVLSILFVLVSVNYKAGDVCDSTNIWHECIDGK